jgi:AsmA-like C-terminal region
VLLEHFGFRNLTWISYSGIAVAYDGEIDFDAHWRPRHAELRRPGISPPFTLTLTREGDADRWQTRIHVGGGTAHGNVALKSATSGAMHLSGQLVPHDIEVASALSAFNRRSPVGGKSSGQMVLSADGKSVGELARSLHTRSVLSVNPATILHFDLDKAISTRGKEHDGQTVLQELTGQMDTQNTNEGMRVTYTGIKARAGKYTATGEATIYHRQIEASGTLDLVEGAIGVPFTVSGPVDKPKASVPPGFFAGAAIGTAVLPGIGTVIGARIGGALGRIIKGGAQQPVAPTPVALKKH